MPEYMLSQEFGVPPWPELYDPSGQIDWYQAFPFKWGEGKTGQAAQGCTKRGKCQMFAWKCKMFVGAEHTDRYRGVRWGCGGVPCFKPRAQNALRKTFFAWRAQGSQKRGFICMFTVFSCLQVKSSFVWWRTCKVLLDCEKRWKMLFGCILPSAGRGPKERMPACLY